MSPSKSDSKKKTLSQFRQELFSEGILHEGDTIGTDDGTLRRFLRARKYNVRDAKKMFSDAQDWRNKVNLDELYKQTDPFDYPEREAVFDCWPMWFHKTDKLGRPLNFHFLGGLDLQRLAKEGVTPERHWDTILVNAECLTREILPAAAKKHDKDIDSVFVIVDLKGFGLSKFWQMKTLAQKSFQMSQDYYPETMGKLAILNAPSTFTFIWQVVRPWLAKETADKVDVLGSDYREKLLELIDEENLPAAVGGKCTCQKDGDGSKSPRCHLSATGPWLEGRVGWGPNAKTMDKAPVSQEQAKDIPGKVGVDDTAERAHDNDDPIAGATQVNNTMVNGVQDQ